MKMILSDGTELDNLELNGNNYVSKEEVTREMFEGKLDTVTIESEEGTEEMTDCVLDNLMQYGDEWLFIIRARTPEESAALDLEAQVMYTAFETKTLL